MDSLLDSFFYYIPAVVAILTIVLLSWIVILHIKLKRMLRGKDAKNLEDTIVELGRRVDDFSEFRKELETYLGQVEKRLTRSIQGFGTIRFNPFKGTGSGGNQSFAVALLNEEGDGVVLSSLYSRDRVSVFAKPVKKNSSEFELTNEEKEAIKNAFLEK